jgi:hypothetical protein
VEILVKKGAVLNMLEVNIRYQDDKEKISFITVEGSASIVKSNIVSRTIAAVRVEKGADVLLEQTSVRISPITALLPNSNFLVRSVDLGSRLCGSDDG